MFSKSAIWVVVVLLLLMLYKQFDSHGVTGGAKPSLIPTCWMT
jgi:cell division protease FtsH